MEVTKWIQMGLNLHPKILFLNLMNTSSVKMMLKRKVAIALRNRYRRSLLDEETKQEIAPKNILMIGPNWCG